MKRFSRPVIGAVILGAILSAPVLADGVSGTIKGHVTDSAGGVLQGAMVMLVPKGGNAVTDKQGDYTIVGLTAGDYTVNVSYVGFSPFTKEVTVAAGQLQRVDATLAVAAQSEQILVRADRPRGEAAQINRERTADNIVQVLPAEVITSLPNANIADALGRLPSVTLERDEGEGKYVQIRGTEPRLSNTTIDGISVPSPESGVRQIKLDTLPSDLVESVEINKTLQANMDGDGIGGSVNLRTKTANDVPTVMLSALGGYTPIINGRGVDQFGATAGMRFGADKKVGVLVGGTYDWNGRGINDLEPSPTVTSLDPHYDSIDLRDYMYYRTRWGVSGSSDYRLNNATSLSLRGLYSDFRNWGQKWVYTLNDGDTPGASIDWRRPETSVGNLVAAGHHTLGMNWLSWDASAARSRMLGGSGGASFTWTGKTPNCVDDPAATTNVYVPVFSASCYAAGTNVQDNANYKLSSWQPASGGGSSQLNLQGSASFGKIYQAGGHFGTLEFGGKIRNADKNNGTYSTTYTVKSGLTIPVAQLAGSFADPSFYGNSYPWPSNNADYTQVQSYVLAHPDQFTVTGGVPGPSKSTYDLTERVTAGYVMNTVDLSAHARLVTGVRVEATHVDTLSYNSSTKLQDFKGGGDYVDVLPSAALKFATSDDGSVRLAFSRALSRPNPSDITKAAGLPNLTQNPPTISLGNPDLRAEHANNFDLLFEQCLHPLGMISAGYFFKSAERSDHRDPDTADIGAVCGLPGVAAWQRGKRDVTRLRGRLPAALDLPAGSAGGPRSVGQLQLHDVPGAGDPAPDRHGATAPPGAEYLEHQSDLRPRIGVSPRRSELQRAEHLCVSVSEPEQRRHADGGWRPDRRWNEGTWRRQLPVRPLADRRAGDGAGGAWALAGGIRAQPDQRGVRLLQRQPAVRRAARVLQADLRRRRPVQSVA